MGEIAHPGPTVFFARRDAEHAERAELGPELARKGIAAVDLVGARRDLGIGEAHHALAQRRDVLAEREVEPPPDIRDHGSASQRTWVAQRRAARHTLPYV